MHNQFHIPVLHFSEFSEICITTSDEKVDLDLCLHQLDVLLNPLQEVDWDLFFAGGDS
ncbi:hypothetical protein HMI56_004314 [Coelomomyces lativittatus]|nr:hypothetical protein HMI56_004314 [Coelomomyces lativittatus]